MRLVKEHFDGLYELEYFQAEDNRGIFSKPFGLSSFKKLGLNGLFKECFFTKSNINTIRGMHFQLPPHEHSKLIYVSSGRILDVVLDIRKGSQSFGRFVTFELSESDKRCIYIAPGFAHGFCALENDSQVNYLVTSEYDEISDAGIHYDSFGFDWPVKNPILSSRDAWFVGFEHYEEFIFIDWDTSI